MCLFCKAVRQGPWCGQQKSHKQWGLINCEGCNLWKPLFLCFQSPWIIAASLSVLHFLATYPLSKVTTKEAERGLALSTLCHLQMNPSVMPSLQLCLSLPWKERWRKESLIHILEVYELGYVKNEFSISCRLSIISKFAWIPNKKPQPYHAQKSPSKKVPHFKI